MATKKQIILPIAVLLVGLGGFAALSVMKKPPEEKAEVDNTPLVAIKKIEMKPMIFSVGSYGVVKAKYETELVSQVYGEIVFLSNTFVRGGFVKKGDILAKIDPSDYDADLIDAEASLASARAALVQERAFGKVAEEEWKRIKDGVPTELSLRKPQLAHEIAKLNSSEAGLKRALRNVERTIIKAPFDALIESRNIGLGSYVSQATVVGKLLSTAEAEIRLPLADKEIQYLSNKGKDANVELIADFGGKKQQWFGKIVRSEGVIDSRSRMTYLVAEVIDPYGLKTDKNELRYGTYVTANIAGNNAGNVTVLPRHLVINGTIAILDEDKKLRYKPVNVIRQFGAEVVISEGLEPGMKVITSALDYPIEGMQLALPEDKILQHDDTQESETQLAMEEE
ncbi:efflux RND transporter periplasmic adaptor subunit [Shewanella sp. D64]|uniref:efflux RND transporter periplasmic adaptor subunit n=1 Tax=unclassified Shewanella TaxID=196818 RepID=UPI0022BA2725|nr:MULTISPECIES: efflux RND transporter periplasmic adaptor subunit [unclassified Shewanella]MEC4723976.1 efflux RND transporter periplasmic adaptor subunit [Shewanella sp. D64]MEC4735996.1 efflux RND transporter periplasmic adaptor subunit [Shewanella sp. E94]WBJ93042.1 efflux RND transporter periplasmic adaptor subunit [Shewanella sp. MTB7]